MNSIHLYLRKVLRQILARETRAVLRKHNPTLIAFCGDDETTILRETLYHVARIHQPARRTIERADSEFSIPLTVFGRLTYPKHFGEWIFITLKVLFQIIFVRPYSHTLIVHVDNSDAAIREYWLKVLSPQYIIVNSPNFVLPDHFQSQKVHLSAQDIFRAKKTGNFSQNFSQILNILDVSTSDARHVLRKTNPMEPRVKLLAGKQKNSLVIDARYHYYPPSLVALAEICESIPGKKLMIIDFQISRSFAIPHTTIITSNAAQVQTLYAVYIFVTRKDNTPSSLVHLVENPLEV